MRRVKLTQGYYALVDNEDYARVSQYSWQYNVKNKLYTHAAYAQGYVNGKNVYLHRFILEVKDKNKEVDHINGNKLDNRKVNLRVVTHKINMRNRRNHKKWTSKYVGVHFHRINKKWRSQITIDGKITDLGCYSTQKEAYNAKLNYIKNNNLMGY